MKILIFKDKEYVYLNAVKYKNKFFSRYPLNDKNKKYLKYLLNKIFKSKYFSKKNKENLKINFDFI